MRCNACDAEVAPNRSDCDNCFTPVGAPAVHPEVSTYRVRGIGLAASVLVGLSALLYLLVGAWPLAGRMFAERAKRELDPDILNAAALGEGLMGLAYGVCFVAAAVLVIIWTYRARVNLDAFPGSAPDLSQGWSIAGWLVPLVNLVVPIRMLATIARSSLAKVSTPLLVWIWCASWLVFVVGERVVSRRDSRDFAALPSDLADQADYQLYIDYYTGALLPNLVMAACCVVAGVSLIMLISRTSRAQERRMARRWPTGVVTPGMTLPA